MIKTKQPVLVDAEEQRSAIVYFEVTHYLVDRLNKKIYFNVGRFEENENGDLALVKEKKVAYKKSTYDALFGGLTEVEKEAQFDSLLIQQIHYVNNVHDWTGDEASRVRYWDLTADDLEVVQ